MTQPLSDSETEGRGKCRSCLGTGWQMQLNSMFVGDEHRRERCHICEGSGHSTYAPAPGQEAWQKTARARQAAMDAYKREHPHASYIELGRMAIAAVPDRRAAA